ncbi:hypothetical protein ACQ4WY_02655 [Janthinobacterium sp. LB2P49]|uniref:hypothetical protein n=1 Tax=Janthinobacterium sp. LB2P49 TaxID=3424198 RepID=UPI003F23A288
MPALPRRTRAAPAWAWPPGHLATWAALVEADKEIALRKAMIFMATYRTGWAGRRVYQRQALD